jgi:hypothetical protein
MGDGSPKFLCVLKGRLIERHPISKNGNIFDESESQDRGEFQDEASL